MEPDLTDDKRASGSRQSLCAHYSRRTFLKAVAAAGIGSCLAVGSERGALAESSGSPYLYATSYSVEQGGTLGLHISTLPAPPSPITIKITRYGSWISPDQNLTITNLTTSPAQAYTGRFGSAIAAGPALAQSFPTDYEGQSNDWGWQVTHRVSIPADMPSGIYKATISWSGGSNVMAFVVTAAPASRSSSRILYKVSVNTIFAYNTMPGSRSLYNWRANDPLVNKDGYQITLRSMCTSWGYIDQRDVPMIDFLEGSNKYAAGDTDMGLRMDYCTDVDLEIDGMNLATTGTSLLDNYNLLLSVGHDEYWGAGMRSSVERFVSHTGGSVGIFGGNTCFWRVKTAAPDTRPGTEAPFTALVCNKGGDPEYAFGPDQWFAEARFAGDAPLRSGFDQDWAANSETSLLGVSSRFSGSFFAPTALSPNAVPPPLGYRVQYPDHWIYAGPSGSSRVQRGYVFGSKPNADDSQHSGIVGYESDGALVEVAASGNLVPLYGKQVEGVTVAGPRNLLVLGSASISAPIWAKTAGERMLQPGYTPAWYYLQSEFAIPGSSDPATAIDKSTGVPPAAAAYNATMGIFSNYGTVFNASTIYWSKFLREPTDGALVRLITRNVVNRLSLRPPYVSTKIARTVVGGFAGPGGAPHILFTNTGTNDPVYWQMSTSPVKPVSAGSLIYNDRTLTGYRVVGTGQFDHTALPCIVFQSTVDNSLAVWRLDNSLAMTTPLFRLPSPGVGFKLVATPDIDGNGISDLLFQSEITGELKAMLYTGSGMTAPVAVSPSQPNGTAGPAWRVVGVANWTGSAAIDIVFQNQNPTDFTWGGTLCYWSMEYLASARTYVERAIRFPTPSVPVTRPWSSNPYMVVGAFDLDGDGVSDLVFQHPATGVVVYWPMNQNGIRDHAKGAHILAL
jgi:hypothetical protein